LAHSQHNNDSATIDKLDEGNDGDNIKLQIAPVRGVGLKDGPAHRIHINILLCGER
jgi:hypothetical protein